MTVLGRLRSGSNSSLDRRVKAAIAREEQAGWRFALFVRLGALALVFAWLAYSVPFPRVGWWLGLVALFALSGLVPYWLRHRRRWRFWVAAFIGVDAILLTLALLAPNPLASETWPIQMTLRLHNNLYLFVFLAGAALSYAPSMVLWTGLAAASAWSVGVYLILTLPATQQEFVVTAPPNTPEALDQALAGFLDPFFVNVSGWLNEVVLLSITALIVAAAVWRSRRLLARQVSAERARASLARYFSPDVVERLAVESGAFDKPNQRQAAVLFVDVVGFTRICERISPESCISLLRSFHARMGRCVFAHGGTLDKFIGDGMMATFGTLESRDDDARRALAAARAMLEEVKRWNAKRARRGAEPISVGIGLHYGTVTVGNVGSDRQLEFTAIGDTVNIASRLERLTRDLQVRLVASGALVTAAEAAAEPDGGNSGLLKDLVPAGETHLRGRETPVPVFALREESAPSEVSDEVSGQSEQGEAAFLPSHPVERAAGG
ncbi:adenylate/guanylate cyclase domain-containing protein [Algihabitans albus]|uniref:adenylate/guanylate cyclase domain-containing protein n=1 Tax=Algihabitans albus TaxID=2164067 RepID=UPI000E5D44EB|nr:adenylate/guanylate cyclase domain-containing protein [Algihabitans albus]